MRPSSGGKLQERMCLSDDSFLSGCKYDQIIGPDLYMRRPQRLRLVPVFMKCLFVPWSFQEENVGVTCRVLFEGFFKGLLVEESVHVSPKILTIGVCAAAVKAQ